MEPGDTRQRDSKQDEHERREPVFLRTGRYAWATLGIVAALVVAGLVVAELSLLFIPLVIALFPAALLAPVAEWLKKIGVPAAVAAILTVLGGLGLIIGIFAVLVAIVIAELPDLVESASEGVDALTEFLEDDPLGLGIGGPQEAFDQAVGMLGDLGEYTGQALTAATTVVEAVIGIIFALVVLFFYLKDNGRIADGAFDLLPDRARVHVDEVGARIWGTLGAYFRGQLLVALVDAIFIGIGLVILGIPLAIPLAVLVFFGGLFPIVGAVVTGALAVLVALADAGLAPALIVLGLVLAVQQLESNVLEPLILGRSIHLHPLAVLVSITAGALTLGILGAFLAVPIAASLARVVEYFRGLDGDEAEEASDDEPDDATGGEEEAVEVGAVASGSAPSARGMG